MWTFTKQWTTTFFLLLFAFTSQGQEFGEFLHQLRQLTDPGDKFLKIDSLIQAQDGLPYIVGDSCHFLFRGVASTVAVSGDFNSWASNEDLLYRELQTDFWHVSKKFEPTARLDYKFVLDGSNWILDPRNPNTVPGGFGPNSEVAMPDYVQPWEINDQPGIPKGQLLDQEITSNHTQSTYELKIYLPPGYDPQGTPGYRVAYFQDGNEYLQLANAKTILDNLIDSTLISRIIAVFIQPTDRNAEYAFGKRDAYAEFVAKELVPYIDDSFNTLADANGRLTMGPSFGGNISGLIAYRYPEVFSNCGLHSPAFWPNNFEVFQWFQNDAVVDVRLALNWGKYEGLATSMPLFVNVLADKEYPYLANEFPEGHSWGLWRATIDDFLIYFFPFDPVSSIDDPGTDPIIHISPVPASNRLTIQTEHKISSLMICDSLGKKVYSEEDPNELTVNVQPLAPGSYFIILVGDFGWRSMPFIKH